MKEVVIDIETEKEFREVGGKDNMHLLGVTVVGTYRYDTNEYYAFEKEESKNLEVLLSQTPCIIGFNVKHFDIPVLAPHVSIDLSVIPVLDLMDDVERHLGFRVSLDNLCHMTLRKRKSGMGLEAISWWRNGEKEKVKEYCLNDVLLTKELYEFGRQHGFVICETRDRGVQRIPVNWAAPVIAPKRVLEDALGKRLTVEIEYREEKRSEPIKHKVEVHSIGQDVFEGFCHIKQAKRSFRIAQITGVALTNESYQLVHDVQRSLI
ncbi:MAG: ribonuclease H-like domain-containing protein [Patescibacteria group bacterium]